jgi:flagellar motor switch protein FliM
MGEILSQDEVTALLQAVDDGGLPEGQASSGEGRSAVRALDLANLQWSVEARFPGLKPLVDRFGRALRSSLATFLGRLPNVSPRPAQMVKYGTIVESLVPPVSLQIFRMAPLPGHGMLVATPPLVAALLQAFFGGDPGHKTPVQSHEFSAIELRALERLGGKVLRDLREAWAPVETLDCALVRSEADPRFAAIAGAQDLVLVIDVGVECQGCEDGRLMVYIPNAALEPVRSRLQATGDAEPIADPAWSERLRAALAGAAVEVSAELGSHRMTMHEVLNLAVGDVIPLGTGREGPVIVRVEGRARFFGAPGVASGHNAVRVTAAI